MPGVSEIRRNFYFLVLISIPESLCLRNAQGLPLQEHMGAFYPFSGFYGAYIPPKSLWHSFEKAPCIKQKINIYTACG